MEIWYGLIGVQCLLTIVAYKMNCNSRIIAIMLIVLMLYSGFRYGLGSDYFPYVNIYQTMALESNIEPFWKYLILVLQAMGFDYQMMFLLAAIMTLIFFYQGLRYYVTEEKYCILGILLFAVLIRGYFMTMNEIRQGLAIAIFFFSSRYIFEYNVRKYLIWCLIMCTVHYSAVILPFFYLLGKWKCHLKSLIIVFAILGLLSYFYVLNSLLVVILPIIGLSKYLTYLSWSHVIFNSGVSFVFYFAVWIFLSYLIFYKCNDEKVEFCYKFYTMYFCSLVLFSSCLPAERLGWYFIWFVIPLLCNLLREINIKVIKSIICLILLAYVVLFFAILWKDNIKYQTIPGYYNNVVYSINLKLLK